MAWRAPLGRAGLEQVCFRILAVSGNRDVVRDVIDIRNTRNRRDPFRIPNVNSFGNWESAAVFMSLATFTAFMMSLGLIVHVRNLQIAESTLYGTIAWYESSARLSSVCS